MNMKGKLLYIFLGFSSFVLSQDIAKSDSGVEFKEKKIELNLDIVNRYLWRGQCWGGDYVAIQPTIEYAITPKLSIGFWGTTNFQDDYFYGDGVSSYKGYQEIDFYLTYQIADFLSIQIWDYYWPSVSKVEGVDNRFFNYGKDGVKTVDAILYFDFSEGYKYPFNATISTLISGNDFRYDNDGLNPKRNFTTYLELGYTFAFFENSAFKAIQNIEVSPVIGAVLNNNAAYYNFADYDRVSFCNMGLKASKVIDLTKGIAMPVSLNYIHNGALNNTELFGKNFLVAGVSFNY